MRGWTSLRIVAILALVMNVASAHHPFSAHYNATKSGMITGKIAAVQWTNPHVVLALDVESDGKTERWMIEGYLILADLPEYVRLQLEIVSVCANLVTTYARKAL